MWPDQAIQLIREIYPDETSEEIQQKLQEHPGEVIVSLLTAVKKDLRNVSATLRTTVEHGAQGVMAPVQPYRAEQHGKKELAKK